MDNKLVPAGGAALGAFALFKYLDSKFFISNDLKSAVKLVALKRAVKRHLDSKHTVADVWEESVDTYGPKEAFIFHGKSYTFTEIDHLANRFAAWGASLGLKQSDVVALYMQNRPEYVAFWLGMAKIGVVTALINFNVRGKPLMHSVKISGARFVVTDTAVGSAIGEINDTLAEHDIRTFIWDNEETSYATALMPIIATVGNARPPKKIRKGLGMSSKALLIYTSGTTGLPKAAAIPHIRFFSAGFGFKAFFGIKSTDRIYCCLPLYHSAGGMLGVGMMITAGATLVLREKFSAGSFWSDCREYNCTVVQYIGELCRYLTMAPVRVSDANNSVRIAIGNGLRPEVWPTFQSRFGIPEIGEFYGSTEGNATLLNHCVGTDGQGTIGRTGALYRLSQGLRLVKFDVEKEEPMRDVDGYCIECEPDEAGELIAPIVESDPLKRFSGYHANPEATKKKVLEHVFAKGDKYFRTGDLLRQDAQGYWYFVDRIGDTFRWKGENVSTNEVAEIASVIPGVADLNVYGVEVPGHDGRACMAALVPGPDFDFKEFHKQCSANLPSYAVPLFIRLLPEMEVTGTFKLQKVQLRKQGCDPTLIEDKLYILDKKSKAYIPFTVQSLEEIRRGGSKL